MKKYLVTIISTSICLVFLCSINSVRADAVAALAIQNAQKAAVAVVRRLLEQQYLNGLKAKSQTANKEVNDITGSDPGPAWVTDWRNFEIQAQQRGERIQRSILANTPLCNYLDKDVKNAYRVRSEDKISLDGHETRIDDLDPFTLKYRCTMPEGFNLNRYEDDPVNNGGWEAFDRLLEPQNNIYGVLLGAQQELEKQRAYEEQADRDRAIAGNTYLGKTAPCRAVEGKCVFKGDVIVPASQYEQADKEQISGPHDEIAGSHDLGDIIAQTVLQKIINAAIKKLDDYKNSTPDDNTNNQGSVEETEKMEYCTAQKPQPTIISKYQAQFDPFGFAAQGGPICGVADAENPFPQQNCIQQCLQTLGILPPQVPNR